MSVYELFIVIPTFKIFVLFLVDKAIITRLYRCNQALTIVPSGFSVVLLILAIHHYPT